MTANKILINRAPVLTLWASVVAERFLRLTGSKELNVVVDATLQPIWGVTRLFPSHGSDEAPGAAQGSG
jgi:hypothetical protein